MTLHAMDLKLLRDLRRLWAQALAIGLVLACGVMVFMIGFGTYRALEATREQYYEANRFADIFAAATRVPNSLRSEIAGIDGVWAVETRISAYVILDLPNRRQAAVGRIISVPPGGPLLNVPVILSGRLPDPESTSEVAINAPFAKSSRLQPGDHFQANLNGRKRELTVTGTVLSPEFVYTLPPGGLMPDNAGFGILYMPEAAAGAAFNLNGAFNDVTLKLSHDASDRSVIDAVDAILKPYGGSGAYDRSVQLSNSFIESEIMQLRNMTYMLPPIFFGIAAFLVNMVLARIITLERTEIGLAKAFGYTNLEIAIHYIMLAGVIAVGAILAGWIVGGWASISLARLYARFYDFPYVIKVSVYDAYAVSGLIGLAAAVIGAVRSAISAARLPPAIAMQPPAPPQFRNGIINRTISRLRLSQPTLMILRALVRWPVRSALTTLGMALGLSIVVASSFFNDSFDRIMDVAFYRAQRQNVTLGLTTPVSRSVIEAVRTLPGVLGAEAQYDQPVILRFGSTEKRTAISTLQPGADLARLVDDQGQPTDAAVYGIVLSEHLARVLGATVGDMIEAEFTDGRRETHEVVVSKTVPQFFGISAYMDPSALAALNRTSEKVGAVHVLLDLSQRQAFEDALKTLPGLAAHVFLTDVRRSFQDTLRENVNRTNIVYIAVAVLITIGIAYNAARIQLSERARELASLRILGFTKVEVSYILFGELLLLALLAQPLGWLLGAAIAWSIAQGFDSDLYRIPFVVNPASYAQASLIVLAAVVGSLAVVLRRLNRIDLVAVMKTRE